MYSIGTYMRLLCRTTFKSPASERRYLFICFIFGMHYFTQFSSKTLVFLKKKHGFLPTILVDYGLRFFNTIIQYYLITIASNHMVTTIIIYYIMFITTTVYCIYIIIILVLPGPIYNARAVAAVWLVQC